MSTIRIQSEIIYWKNIYSQTIDNNCKLFFSTRETFARINVGRTKVIDVIGIVIGWLYFAAWSISFYPQIWINFKRKSVVGLNFDYIGLNITGFLCYSLFNVCLYFSSYIQSQFEEKNPRHQIPVELNDVVFALHAVFATIIVIFQCIIYEVSFLASKTHSKPSIKIFIDIYRDKIKPYLYSPKDF